MIVVVDGGKAKRCPNSEVNTVARPSEAAGQSIRVGKSEVEDCPIRVSRIRGPSMTFGKCDLSA